jgi:hypothetical protein
MRSGTAEGSESKFQEEGGNFGEGGHVIKMKDEG